MSKRSDPAAFARATGAADPVTLAEADPAPAPDLAPLPQVAPESAGALAVASAPDDDDDLIFPPEPSEPYDPADYRWVPVRRKPRLDGWTEEKQRRFIETLADTGLVNAAAKAVGMSRKSAYALRRSENGAAFARAWDMARENAGALVEDMLFERAIEGTEEEVLDNYGNVIATRLVHDNGLLKWLLSRLKPERYGNAQHRTPAPETPAVPALVESLRDMEPALPAPPEQLLDPETFAFELHLADIADGKLPHFLSEQRTPKTDAQLKAEQNAARDARGEAAAKKQDAGQKLTDDEFADLCFHIDPISNARPLPRRRE